MSHMIEATPRQLIIEAEVKRMARYSLERNQPKKPHKKSKSGILGVSWNGNSKRWQARAPDYTYLGTYKCKLEAGKAVLAGKNLNQKYKLKDDKK